MSISFPINETMRVRFAGETDVGMKRTHNEDYLYIPEEEKLIMVADGMGGHAAGDVASRLAVETISDFFHLTEDMPLPTWPFKVDDEHHAYENRLITGIKLANSKIFDISQRDNRSRGMGTTIVACLFTSEKVTVAHVGDSRIYLVRDERFRQVTEDHSLLNDYIRMKRIGPNEIDSFPHKNVIVRALGMKETVEVDIWNTPPQIGDIFLLCSDGLSGMISDQKIHEILLTERDAERCCEKLVEQANANGGQDNITVALARVEKL